MYTGLLHSHSLLRYVVLILLIITVAKSLMGLLGKKPFGKTDEKLTLWLMIATHTQLLVGVSLFFISPYVKFNAETMKDPVLRHWSVEHGVMMLVVVTLITIARLWSKKQAAEATRHKRVFILTALALVIAFVAITAGGRGVFIPTEP